MHSYMEAIGLGKYETKKQICELLDEANGFYKTTRKYEDKGVIYVEICVETGDGMGITIYGNEDEEDTISIDYYFPYAIGMTYGNMEEVSVEKQLDNDVYKGACDDIRLGVSLIFHLQNSFRYRERIVAGDEMSNPVNVYFSALSTDGKIILPLSKSEHGIKNTKSALSNHNKLLTAAKEGDEDAIQSLTFEDIDTYNMINRRIKNEDVFTIVESSFMPYGIQCDRYMMIGTIKEVEMLPCVFSTDSIYKLIVECNDMMFTVMINKKHLIGEPAAGRRFKGVIWLQGRLAI